MILPICFGIHDFLTRCNSKRKKLININSVGQRLALLLREMERSYTFIIGVFAALGILSWWSQGSAFSEIHRAPVTVSAPAKVLANPPLLESPREPASAPSTSQPLEIEAIDH